MKRCMGCMENYNEQLSVCPHCGYVEGTLPDEAIHMPAGSVLANRFLIGRVVGYGGFGVTYLGWDTVLEHKVAIKEYLPSEFSTRIPGQTEITVFEGDKNEQYHSGLDKFVDEAKKLAKFNNLPGIVKVYDSFKENGTAYIVMEYLHGENMGEILKREGTIPYDQAVEMLMPVMESLCEVHKQGIIHRDLAPDNMMVTAEGQIKLIDFGAARYATTSHSRSLSVIIKPGYSPEEQYRSRGDQGPHTDVYAVGATLYKMITGITPPDAFERRAFYEKKRKDILEPISKYCKDIPQNIENAILNAMNVRIEDRSKDVGVLIKELTSDKPVKRIYGKIKKIDVLKWPLWAKIGVPVASCLIITLGILFATGVIGFKSDLQTEIKIPDGMTIVPKVTNQSAEDAITSLEDANLMYAYATPPTYSMIVPANYIFSQDISAGKVVTENTMVTLTVCAGIETKSVPELKGKNVEETKKIIEEIEGGNFTIEIIEEYSIVEKGQVIEQNFSGETPIGSTIVIKVSKGQDPNATIEEKNIIMPDFVGKSYSEAIDIATDIGIVSISTEYVYSDEDNKDIVLKQNIAAGTEIKNTEVIKITISLGIKYVTVPFVKYYSLDDAVKLLEDRELGYVVIKEEYNDAVPANSIISQSINDGEQVVSGTVIELVVSLGASPIEVADVVGKTEEEAKELLKDLALTINYENSEEVKAGNVISQSIEAGKEVSKSTAICITVSSGEKLYEVPNVLGKTKDEAIKLLEEQKYVVQSTEIYDEEYPEGQVCSQSLVAGSKYVKKTDIIIMISKGKQPLVISYDANGGTADKESEILNLGDKYNLPNVERKGYTFVGWFTNVGIEKTATSIVEEKINHTLTAKWTANTYNVNFEAEGTNNIQSIVVTYDSTYGDLPVVSRTGYTFVGWYTKASDGELIKPETVVKITQDQTLYAQWEAIEIEVYLSSNDELWKTITVKFADTYGELPTPTLVGYTFDGWYTSLNYDTVVTSSTKVTNVDEHWLYPKWKENSYTVTYNANNGSGNMSPSTHYYATASNLTANICTRTGYTFAGWNTKADGTGTSYSDKASIKKLTETNGGNVTLYAVWTANTYTVTYNGNGSTSGSTSSSSHTYDTAKTLTANGFSKTGYTFQGWSTSSTATSATYTNKQSVKNLTSTNGGTVTLYAVWKINTYTVTFNSQSGTSVSSKTVNYNGTISSLPTTTRTYYTFKGWYTGTGGTGTKLTTSTKITANVTYYAYWTENAWSDWTSTLPSSVTTSGYQIQYRYMDLGSWVTQGYTATPGTTSTTYKLTGNTKNGDATAWKTQYCYYGYTNNTYWTYCAYGNNLYSPWYVETGWLDTALTATFDAYDVYTTHNCGHSDCPASQGTVYGYTYKYGGNRYYLYKTQTVATAWQTLYEYATCSWPSTWTTSSTAVTASDTRKVQYRYRKK